MKIFVSVKPGSKREEVNPVREAHTGHVKPMLAKQATHAASREAFSNGVKSADGTHVTVWVHARAHDGKANEAVMQVLAKHFGVASSRIRIVHGYTSRQKVIEIV